MLTKIAQPARMTGMRRTHEMHNLTHLGHVQVENIMELHNRAGHADTGVCAEMLGIRARDSITKILRSQCAGCSVAKIHDEAPGPARPPPTAILQRVQIDSCGPYPPSYQYGYEHEHTFTDVFSSYVHQEYSVTRGEGVELAKTWLVNSNARHAPNRVVDLDMDGAPEYTSKAFKKWVKEELRAELHIGAPYSPFHQSHAERPHRTIKEMGLASRVHAGMPPPYWHFSHVHATCVRMLLPNKRTRALSAADITKRAVTPTELWHNYRATSFTELLRDTYTFGCTVVAFRPKETRLKTDPPGVPGIYLCPDTQTKGHMILVLDTGRVKTYRTLRAHQTEFPFLIELRKAVPRALTFAAHTEAEVLAPLMAEEAAATPIALVPLSSGTALQQAAVEHVRWSTLVPIPRLVSICCQRNRPSVRQYGR